MKYSEIVSDIMDSIQPESTALQVIHRLSSQVISFAVEELRSNPPGAFRAVLTREAVKVRIEDLKSVLAGKEDLDFPLLAGFTFTVPPDQGRLHYQVSMYREAGSSFNWPNIATFNFSLDRWDPTSANVHLNGTSQRVVTGREQFHNALMSDEGVTFRNKTSLHSFLNFFTASPEDMMRHGYMMMEDLDNPDFRGVFLKSIKKKGTDIVTGMSMKFLHLDNDPRPELYITVHRAKDNDTGAVHYNMKGAEDYDTQA